MVFFSFTDSKQLEKFVSRNQGDFNCSSLPAGQGGNGEFERKLEEIEEIWGEIIQNEVNLWGSPTIKVTMNVRNEIWHQDKYWFQGMKTKHLKTFFKWSRWAGQEVSALVNILLSAAGFEH